MHLITMFIFPGKVQAYLFLHMGCECGFSLQHDDWADRSPFAGVGVSTKSRSHQGVQDAFLSCDEVMEFCVVLWYEFST